MVTHTFAEPDFNLAYEEVLLDGVESGATRDTLRLWESRTPFVVLGVSQRLRQEVDEQACKEDGVLILRRCSAGGCVLQGPGCLNFTLALRYTERPELGTIRGSYQALLGAVCAALDALGIAATLEGVSDLAVMGRKVSGNAQKRRRHALLHHGTLLYSLDLRQVARYLREPEDRPDYRGRRRHDEFLRMLPAGPEVLRLALQTAFGAIEPAAEPTEEEFEEVRRLATTKYLSPDWIYRR